MHYGYWMCQHAAASSAGLLTGVRRWPETQRARDCGSHHRCSLCTYAGRLYGGPPSCISLQSNQAWSCSPVGHKPASQPTSSSSAIQQVRTAATCPYPCRIMYAATGTSDLRALLPHRCERPVAPLPCSLSYRSQPARVAARQPRSSSVCLRSSGVCLAAAAAPPAEMTSGALCHALFRRLYHCPPGQNRGPAAEQRVSDRGSSPIGSMTASGATRKATTEDLKDLVAKVDCFIFDCDGACPPLGARSPAP